MSDWPVLTTACDPSSAAFRANSDTVAFPYIAGDAFAQSRHAERFGVA